MTIKRKAKRTAKRKLKLKLKPKRNVVTVKRKAVTRGEGILERELGRLPRVRRSRSGSGTTMPNARRGEAGSRQV